MPARADSSSTTESPAQTLARAEMVVWIGLVLLTSLVTVHTARTEFPARTVALFGEGVVALVCAGLAAWALRNQRRAASVDPRWPALAIAAPVLRVIVLVPLVLFALVVAAAGYAA